MMPRGSLWLLVPIAFAGAGCEQGLADRPCPCSAGWVCSPATHQCEEGVATQPIDDMLQPEADGPGMNGYWYTYSDKTVPNTFPVVFRSDAGFVSPPEGTMMGFPASDDGNGPFVDGAVQAYRRIDAGGETNWGVGFGMDFVDIPSDGSPIPVNECDAGQVWTGLIPQPFDASAWTGIQFYARSFGGDVAVEIHVDDDRTTPWGQVPLAAGGCNACVSSGADASACSDSFSYPNKVNTKSVPFSAAGWALFQVPFSDLLSDNWSNNFPVTTPIHTNKIYNLHFQVSTKGTPLSPFSIGVSYVSFYKS